LREEWKEDGIESKNGESSEKDAGEKCKGEIDEDSKEESKDHLVWSKDFDKQQASISDSDESQELDPDYVCEKEPTQKPLRNQTRLLIALPSLKNAKNC